MRWRRAWRIGLLGLVGVLLAGDAAAEEGLPEGLEVATRVHERDDGERVDRRIRMELIDAGGSSRVRETRSFRSDAEGTRRTALFFLGPASIRGTSFLTLDHPEADRDDDQWLYLPALRRVRRISAADRGSYFLGTDFTYDDIRTGGRVSVEDYSWKTRGRERVDGLDLLVLEGVAASGEIAEELGYGRGRFWIDEATWMVRRARFWDTNDNLLKTIRFDEVERIEGVWTALRIEAENHKTGHRTRFDVSEVDYGAEMPDSLFTKRSLKRLPR